MFCLQRPKAALGTKRLRWRLRAARASSRSQPGHRNQVALPELPVNVVLLLHHQPVGHAVNLPPEQVHQLPQ